MDNNFKERLHKYIIRLIKFLTVLPRNTVSQEIMRQLIRSGTSVGANYFESQGASTKKDYKNFFSYSLKSSNESKFWLNILKDSNLVPSELLPECIWLQKETDEFARIFASSIITMKNKE
ncbi:MAG: four helix bundle protein [Candidatus Omnitrophota bacterium]